MNLKNISEKQTIEFVKELLDYYGQTCSGSNNIIYTSNDIESSRNNVGWYRHENNEHQLCINVPNMMYATYYVQQKIISIEDFYAFVALCTGHEFRHFEQGTCIYNGKEIDGFNNEDAYNAELMMYIRSFFDSYYLLNKGYVKYEVDAEKFAVENGVKYLKEAFPNINADRSMVNAVNFYAMIQHDVFGLPTLPLGCGSIEEITDNLTKRIGNIKRIPNLQETLRVHNPYHYQNHNYFNLDEDRLLTPGLIQKYRDLDDAVKQDDLVMQTIFYSIDKKEESIENYPRICKRYS